MIRDLRILPEAEVEIEAAAAWYEGKGSGLGAKWIQVIGEALAHIQEAPFAHAIWRTGWPYRRYVLRQFPYVIMYVATDTDVEVTAVAHARRMPGHWMRRNML